RDWSSDVCSSDLDNRYFAEANFGYNGSENFAPDNRYGFFPSFGVAWVISEEPFFENLKDNFQLAKLRFSHGKAGNSRIMLGSTEYRFAYISTIQSTTGYNFGLNRNNNFGTGYNIGEYGDRKSTRLNSSHVKISY